MTKRLISVMLYSPSFPQHGRRRPGRADKTVTRHLSGSYQVTPPGPAPQGANDQGAHRGRQVHIPTPDGQLSHRSDPSKTPTQIFTVQPGGVDREMDQPQVGVSALEAVDARLPGVAGAVVDDQEDRAGGRVRLATHQLLDQPPERLDPGLRL